MVNILHALVKGLRAASPAEVTLLCALIVLAVGLHVLHMRFRDKGAAGPLALGKWLCALGAMRALDEMLPGESGPAFMAVYGVLVWMAARAVIYDIYDGLVMQRLKGRQVNRIHLSLASFSVVALLAAYGLTNVLGVNVSSLLTSSAILTAVSGFSMQDTIGSLFSGLLIQAEKPFKIGDWVRVGDKEGQVAEVTWRYTKLVTFSQEYLLVPNNVIAKERLVNLTDPIPQISMAVNVPAPPDVPPVKVKSALEEVLRRCPLVAQNPPPRVRLAEIGTDQSVYRCAFFVEDFQDTVAARSEVLSTAWYEFQRQGIPLPVARRMMVSGRKNACSAQASDVLGLVAGVGLFSGMHREEMELLLQCAACRNYAPGARIVEEGQDGATMFIIVTGKVAVLRGGSRVAALGPGDVFGEMALLTGEPRQADVVALEHVSCLEVDREGFRVILEKNPALVENVTRIFEERGRSNAGREDKDQPAGQEGLLDLFRRLFW